MIIVIEVHDRGDQRDHCVKKKLVKLRFFFLTLRPALCNFWEKFKMVIIVIEVHDRSDQGDHNL